MLAREVDAGRPPTLRIWEWAALAVIIDHFRHRYGLTRDGLTAGELRAAQELARAKFATEDWTERVP